MDATERYLRALESLDPSPALRRIIAGIRAERRGDWGPTGVEVINAELTACVLGQRKRPELEVES